MSSEELSFQIVVFEFYVVFFQETGAVIKPWTFTVMCSVQPEPWSATDLLYSILLRVSEQVAEFFSTFLEACSFWIWNGCFKVSVTLAFFLFFWSI